VDELELWALLLLGELNELSLECDMLLLALGEVELVEPDEPLVELAEPLLDPEGLPLEPDEPLLEPDESPPELDEPRLEPDEPLPELDEGEPLEPELCELPEPDGLVLEPLD
jgi:hypothetical protein